MGQAARKAAERETPGMSMERNDIMDLLSGIDIGMLLDLAQVFNSPAGLLGAAVVALIVLTVLRKILSFMFLVVAVAAIAWAGWRASNEDERAMADAVSVEQAARGAPRSSLNSPVGNVLAQVQRTIAGGSAAATARDFATVPMAYNRPTTMNLQSPTNVSLLIDLSGVEDLPRGLRGFDGDIIEGSVDVTSTVSASLTGPGFKIEQLSPPQQTLSSRTANRWQWAVTPEVEGERMLTLEIFAHPNGGPAEPVRAYRDEINVTVGTLGKVIVAAQTAEPFLGVAAGGASFLMAIVTFFRRRRGA